MQNGIPNADRPSQAATSTGHSAGDLSMMHDAWQADMLSTAAVWSVKKAHSPSSPTPVLPSHDPQTHTLQADFDWGTFVDGFTKQTKASSKAAEEAFYGFSDFFKDVDKELAERRARRAGALLPAPCYRRSCRWSPSNLWALKFGRFAGPRTLAKHSAVLLYILGKWQRTHALGSAG